MDVPSSGKSGVLEKILLSLKVGYMMARRDLAVAQSHSSDFKSREDVFHI